MRLDFHILAAGIACAVLAVPSPVCAGPPGEAAYAEAVQTATQAEEGGSTARNVADIYLRAAINCQEMGAHKQALDLFELAIRSDPDHAEAHRRYGDYLMNYRAMYEYAAAQYYEAKAIMERDPDWYSDEEKQELDRSFQIMHRDGGDGAPVYLSPAISVFVEPFAEYRRRNLRQMFLYEQELQARCYLSGVEQESADAATHFQDLAVQSARGILYFQEQVDANEEGIVYFQDLVTQNDDGIAYFQEQVQGTYDYDAYLWDELHINRGIGLDEDLGDGTTIRSRMAGNETYRNELLGRVSDIDSDKASNLDKIDQIEQDKTENEKKIGNAAGEMKSAGEKADDARAAEEKAKAQKEAARREVERRPEEFEYGANVLIRFGPTWLPYLKLTAQRTEVDDAAINPMDFDHPYDGTYTRLAALAGKNVILAPRLDLNIEAEISKREAVTHVYDSDDLTEDTVEYAALGMFSYNMVHKTLRLSLGGSFADIENDYSKDDSGNTQLAALRLSLYPAEEVERFGQGRSTHWEVGIRRVERIYRSPSDPDIMSEDYQPYAVCEALGLARGRMDFVAKYVLHQIEYMGGCKEGTYQVHEVQLTPTWVPVYRLYDRDFRTGTENTRIGAPLRISTGDGDFDSLGAGIQIEQRYVTRFGFTLLPTLGAEFTRYTELDVDDWGVFAKLVVVMGARKVISY